MLMCCFAACWWRWWAWEWWWWLWAGCYGILSSSIFFHTFLLQLFWKCAAALKTWQENISFHSFFLFCELLIFIWFFAQLLPILFSKLYFCNNKFEEKLQLGLWSSATTIKPTCRLSREFAYIIRAQYLESRLYCSVNLDLWL